MESHSPEKEGETDRFVELLNQGLKVEYGSIIHYPWLAERLEDRDSRDLLHWIVQESMRHGNIVAGIISALGKEPEWALDPRPEGKLAEILHKQVEMEKLVSWLYRQTADLAPQSIWKEQLLKISQDELGHVEALERIIAKLPPDES